MRGILIVIFLLYNGICYAQGDPDSVPDRQQIAGIGDFKLESGAVIRDCRIGYRTYGKLNKWKNNTVLFPTWFGGTSSDIEEYAEPWQVIDTDRFFLIVADALGNGISSSPSNSQEQAGAQFPSFTIRDMVASHYTLLTRVMRIKSLYAVIGISMGGMQVFQWGMSYPDYVSRLIPIVGTPQPGSYDLMGYSIYRRIIEDDKGFDHGNYTTNPVIPAATMMLEFSLTTPEYKTRAMSRDSFAVWQSNVDSASVPDWNDTYYQLKAIMAHDIARDYGGSLRKAAEHIKARMLIIVSRQDHLVNPLPAMAIAKMLQAKLITLNSEQGHQAPNFEDEAMRKSIAEILSD